jgi:hypothetical protein
MQSRISTACFLERPFFSATSEAIWALERAFAIFVFLVVVVVVCYVVRKVTRLVMIKIQWPHGASEKIKKNKVF